MHLGTLLTKLRREDDAALALAALGDERLFADVAAVGAVFGETPGQYVAAAAARFTSRASHDDWLQLVSSLKTSDDAGRSLLSTVVQWALQQDRRPMGDAATLPEAANTG